MYVGKVHRTLLSQEPLGSCYTDHDHICSLSVLQDFRQYRGHGCPVRNCSFLADDGSLITSGGRDCAVFLWAFEARADAEGAGVIGASSTIGGDHVFTDDPDVETVVMADEDRLRHPDLRDLSR